MHLTYTKAQLASLKVQMWANQLGYVVSIPTVESRYDILVDVDGKIFRCQVKYAGRKLTSGATELDLRKETRNNGKKRLYTKDEIDVILVYVPEEDKVLWIDHSKFHNRKSLTIRHIENTKCKQDSIFVNDYIWVQSSVGRADAS